MELFKYALLGLIQGLTEFLPVSSKSHLLLAEPWLGLDPKGVVLEVSLHVATLLSVVVVYRKDILQVFVKREWKFIGLLALSTCVTVAAIFPLRNQLEALTESPNIVALIGGLLLVTAIWLVFADMRLKHPAARRPLGLLGAVMVGLAQGIAGLPGISRSGATIGMALQMGEDWQNAARYSFLLSIPVIIGAAVLKAPEISVAMHDGSIDPLGLGISFTMSMVAGVAAIHFLLAMLRKARLIWFAAYCVLLSAASLLSYWLS